MSDNLLPAFDPQGYDMVVAITQDTINYQFKQLWNKGVIHKQLTFAGEFRERLGLTSFTAKLDAKLLAPTVEIISGNESRRKLLLHLKMASGTIECEQILNPKLMTFTDWEYVFTVDLDFQEITKAAILSHSNIPQEVQHSLLNFTEDMFTIRHLFMNFQNANLVTFNREKSRCPLPEYLGGKDLTKQHDSLLLQVLQLILEAYFKGLVGGNNPYILGYTVESKNPSRQNKVKPSINPTGATFSTYYDSNNQRLSSLNFLVVTDGHSLPTAPSAGIYSNSLTPSPDVNGRFIVSNASFVSGWLFQQLTSPLSDEKQPFRYAQNWQGVTKSAEITHKGNKSKKPDGYRGIREPIAGDAVGWKFTYDVLYNWHEHHSVPAGLPFQYVDGYFVQTDQRHLALTLENPTLDKAKIKVDGSAYIYYEMQYQWIMWFKGWLDDRIDFCIESELSGGIEGRLGSNTVTLKNVPGSNTNWLNGFESFFNSDTRTFCKQLHSSFGQMMQNQVDGVLTSCNEIQNRFILPAGDVFFFKNPQFDKAGNLLLDVTYKMN